MPSIPVLLHHRATCILPVLSSWSLPTNCNVSPSSIYPISVPFLNMLHSVFTLTCPMVVCSCFFNLYPSISFTSDNFLHLTCVFSCNWRSTSLRWQLLLKNLERVASSTHIFSSPFHLCSFHSHNFLSLCSIFFPSHFFYSWKLPFTHF